jgi:hypothetical protein
MDHALPVHGFGERVTETRVKNNRKPIIAAAVCSSREKLEFAGAVA